MTTEAFSVASTSTSTLDDLDEEAEPTGLGLAFGESALAAAAALIIRAAASGEGTQGRTTPSEAAQRDRMASAARWAPADCPTTTTPPLPLFVELLFLSLFFLFPLLPLSSLLTPLSTSNAATAHPIPDPTSSLAPLAPACGKLR